MKKDNNNNNNIFILNKQKTEQNSQKDYNFLISNPVLMFIKNEHNEKQKIDKENESNEAELEENLENSEVSMESNEQFINGENKYRRGRWTEEEHKNFLKGIINYGNDWKMVEKIVKTRTSSQSRSHAQKYFLKFKNLVEYYNLNERSLYEFITGEYSLSFFFDKQFIQLNLDEKKKLVNTFISNIDLFSKTKNKRRKKSFDKNKKISNDDYNKIFKIESQDDNKSFHSDEDDENDNDNDNDNDDISALNNKKILNNKTKRNKIFNVVKCSKYKYSEEYMKNIDNKMNNKNIKLKFLVQKNKTEKNSNNKNNKGNKGNNNKANAKMNNSYIINNNIININNTNNLDLNVLNIFNYNINTININNINYINNSNESNKDIFENSEKNIIDNNNNFLSFSQKYLSYDFLRNSNNNNLKMFENDEDDELSSLDNNKNKTIFASPL